MKYRVSVEFEDADDSALYWDWNEIFKALGVGDTLLYWDSFKLERHKGWETL